MSICEDEVNVVHYNPYVESKFKILGVYHYIDEDEGETIEKDINITTLGFDLAPLFLIPLSIRFNEDETKAYVCGYETGVDMGTFDVVETSGDYVLCALSDETEVDEFWSFVADKKEGKVVQIGALGESPIGSLPFLEPIDKEASSDVVQILLSAFEAESLDSYVSENFNVPSGGGHNCKLYAFTPQEVENYISARMNIYGNNFRDLVEDYLIEQTISPIVLAYNSYIKDDAGNYYPAVIG